MNSLPSYQGILWFHQSNQTINDFKKERMDYKGSVFCISVMGELYSFKNISDK